MTILDTLISVSVVAVFILIIWSNLKKQSITETFMEIKELFGAIKND